MRKSAAAEERAAELDDRERALERSARERARAYLLEARRRVEQALGLARAAVDEATAKEARRLVEEGVREETAALEEVTGPADALSAPAVVERSAAPGDRVRLATGMTGEVVERRRDGKVVVTVGAVRLVVAAGDILGVIDAAPPPASPVSSPIAAGATVATTPMEVDLRGLTGDEAAAATVSAIDGAVLSEYPHLRIIHGMGTGVVRQRVREVLQQDARVRSFKFAPQSQGGTGVTIVDFQP